MLREGEKNGKLATTLHPALMSSEESEGEVIVVRPLKWRDKTVNDFQQLDTRWMDGLSAQQKRQTAKRVAGQDSCRDKSVLPRDLAFAIRSDSEDEGQT